MNRKIIEADCGAKEAAAKVEQISPAALRALAEADERRTKERISGIRHEIGGRGGQDPARYGDWEIKGRAIDF